MIGSSKQSVKAGFLAVAAGLVLTLSLGMFAGPKDAPSKDIVDTAVAAGSFKTLAAALQAAGLVDTLKGKGPFTVFAPTEEPFENLPAGRVKNLLKRKNKQKRVPTPTNHFFPGRVWAAKVKKRN